MKTKISFTCVPSQNELHTLINTIMNTPGISSLDVHVESFEEPGTHDSEVHVYLPSVVGAPSDEPINEEYTFSEEKPVPLRFLGKATQTSNPLIHVYNLADGGLVIEYASSKVYTTTTAMKKLPYPVPPDKLAHLNSGKQAAIRGYLKMMHAGTLSPPKKKESMMPADPYAPILTGGAKVDTWATGKVEGNLI